MTNIAVVGAGVVGLSTALNIQKILPNVQVTIIADKFGEDTTSVGAGAIIVPWAEGVDEETQKKWGSCSMNYFTTLAVSEDCAESGANIVMGFLHFDTPNPPPYCRLMLTFDRVPQATADIMNMGNDYCYTTTTVMVEMSKYLKYLMKQFISSGGHVEERHVASLKEFVDVYDLVLNCSGMGSRELVGDMQLKPVKGQLLRVSAPWFKHFVHTSSSINEFSSFVLPNQGNVVIGGTKEFDNDDINVDPKTTDKIWKEAIRRWPALKKATVVSEWVGIRPYRTPIRVEKEIMQFGDKTLKVVHNYGHGSFGASMGWGTSVHAAELAKYMIQRTTSKL